ncbi:MAG: hypothetical protein K2N72_10455 [Oscillospiraceae bacterium]|nr:hypothetical protein [Oscillospiraceae bacterium]
MARIMGVSPYTLRSWEQGKAKPPYDIWRLHKDRFADIF